MNKYEAMFIIKPDLNEQDKTALLTQINDIVVKQNGKVTQNSIWAERKKLAFAIKKYHEGTYYLVHFQSPGDAVAKMRHLYQLNENILRVLITSVA
jgi:small subunit ribosomal protein S6